jgi:hypothetical protein
MYINFAEKAIKFEMSLRDILVLTAKRDLVMESVGANDTCTMH